MSEFNVLMQAEIRVPETFTLDGLKENLRSNRIPLTATLRLEPLRDLTTVADGTISSAAGAQIGIIAQWGSE